jgi:hypothetical protein
MFHGFLERSTQFLTLLDVLLYDSILYYVLLEPG